MSQNKISVQLNRKNEIKNYASSFAAGFTSGIAGETFVLLQNKKLNLNNIQQPAYRDAAVISGVQQAAKDFTKNTFRRYPFMTKLSVENPLIFGAATGIPMWALTRIFATPLQNSRKKDVKEPFKGLWKSITVDAGYYTIKNGLDEYFASNVFPKILPKCPNFATQKIVEAALAGLVGGSSYVFAWPYKCTLTGQKLSEAAKLMVKNTPKVSIKKITYTLVKPKFSNLLK